MSSSSSFFHDLLETIVERGRTVFDGGRGRRASGNDLGALAESLVEEPGEASGLALARELLDIWATVDSAARTAFFRLLAERFGPREGELEAAARAYLDDPSPRTARRLHVASEPRRQELFRRLNRAPDGTSALVAMRAELLDRLADHPEFADVDADFEHLLGSWFNRGFLVLRRIDWSTPAVILERIIRYEAVHEINGWDDLRRRIDPPDRRLYAFFHPALTDEPLIFVEVALMGAMPDGIAPILAEEPEVLDPARASVAVFYSISNCQKGLRGISFGNFLIKHVVEELAKSFPNLRTFATLSPMPGFRRWLEREVEALDGDAPGALDLIETPDWHRDTDALSALQPVLKAAAAHYLLHARGPGGLPRDPVARFHLGNGAQLERINFMGNPSAKGLRESCGMMVNYVYDLKKIERNHEAYAGSGVIAATPAVKRLVASSPIRARAEETHGR